MSSLLQKSGSSWNGHEDCFPWKRRILGSFPCGKWISSQPCQFVGHWHTYVAGLPITWCVTWNMQFLKDMGTWRHDISSCKCMVVVICCICLLKKENMTSTLKASSILPSRGSQCNFILKLEVPSETNLGDDLSRALGASCKGMDQGKYTDDCI